MIKSTSYFHKTESLGIVDVSNAFLSSDKYLIGKLVLSTGFKVVTNKPKQELFEVFLDKFNEVKEGIFDE